MIKQLFKQIWAQRAVNLWIWMELLIVFVCLSYLVDYLYSTARTYFTPLGYNTEHVYLVSLASVSPQSPAYDAGQTDSLRTEYLLTALARMRAYPGVEAVGTSLGAHPYNTSHSMGSRAIDTTWVHGNAYSVSPEFFRVFRVADERGQIEPLMEGGARGIIVSADVARRFAAEGHEVRPGTGIKNHRDTIPTLTVGAICNDIRYDDFEEIYPAFYECRTDAELIKAEGIRTEFCVRVRPEADDLEFASRFRQQMKTQLRLGNIFLMEVTPFDDLRDNYFRGNGKINDVKTRLAGLSFLMLNILLGIIGTFWIRTQHRRSEVGVRIAMGATRNSIRSWLMGEGLILLLLAAVPAIIIDWNITYALIEDFIRDDHFLWGRFLAGQSITLVLMAVMILIGVYMPARQAVKIEPAEALHEEG